MGNAALDLASKEINHHACVDEERQPAGTVTSLQLRQEVLKIPAGTLKDSKGEMRAALGSFPSRVCCCFNKG